ncbi:hypothetical protein D9M72_628460 [compost metagenome]
MGLVCASQARQGGAAPDASAVVFRSCCTAVSPCGDTAVVLLYLPSDACLLVSAAPYCFYIE